ncbi:hypothetical protein COX84_07085, partial [Candidatus Micrarchaeota archaeon CG_4_10_14_0_2_um_filter_49_7]
MMGGISDSSDESMGISFALLTAVVSGFSVFINAFGAKSFDPFGYTLLKNAIAAAAIFCAIAFLSKFGAIRRLTPKNLGRLAFVGIIGGGIPFMLFFYGLSIGSAAAGGFIYRLLFVFTAIISVLLLRQGVADRRYAIGAAIAIAGNLILLSLGKFSFGIGELCALAATIMWALEWTFTKKFLEGEDAIDGDVLAFGRFGIGIVAMTVILAATGGLGTALAFSADEIIWSLIAGGLLFLFATFWYRSLKHTSPANATAILALAGPITTSLNFAFLGKMPGIY